MSKINWSTFSEPTMLEQKSYKNKQAATENTVMSSNCWQKDDNFRKRYSYLKLIMPKMSEAIHMAAYLDEKENKNEAGLMDTSVSDAF